MNLKIVRIKHYILMLTKNCFWGIALLYLSAACTHSQFNEDAAGNKMKNNEISKQSNNADFFSSPEEAIPIISELLKKNNFKTLADYYYLSGTEIDRSVLESGDFFIQNKHPEFSHPGGFWRYKHPFAPGYEYSGTRSTSRKEVYIIEVSISIDQGEGTPAQRGFSLFYMKKSDNGWQILPDIVEEDMTANDMPAQIE